MRRHEKFDFGNRINALTESNPGKSGIMSLSDGYDAFAARMMIAEHAVSTLDIQYYIWKNDLTGTLLFEALFRAAERGVQVRLLLDDHNTSGLDNALATLHSHPHIEIRLFNPFRNRKWRILGNLTDFTRLNRRMHNKSITADNQITIIGGRNVGDEYFNAGQDFLFIDLDIMVVGRVVDEISQDFEHFWVSKMTSSIDRVLDGKPVSIDKDFSVAATMIKNDPTARKYMKAIKSSTASELQELPFEWTSVRMVSDDPSKVMEDSPLDQTLLHVKLLNIVDMPRHELLLVVPYFVPGKDGVEFFTRLRKQNVQVKILTNSFKATDVAIIHAGYTKYRKKLLEAGVILYEMKSSPTNNNRNLTGSSSSSLHAKTFCIDRSEVFIGSCNFDPRSSLLNTEIGVLIESSAMSQKAANLFEEIIPTRSYEVQLNNKKKLIWLERSNRSEIIHEREPDTSIFKRTGMSFFSKLPIEWML